MTAGLDLTLQLGTGATETGGGESPRAARYRNNWRLDQPLSDDDRVNTERWGGMGWRAWLGVCARSGVSDIGAGGKGFTTGARFNACARNGV